MEYIQEKIPREHMLASIGDYLGLEAFEFVVYEPISGFYEQVEKDYFLIPIEEIGKELLDNLRDKYSPNHDVVIGVTSRVNGIPREHLVMIDFNCEIGPEGINRVKEVCTPIAERSIPENVQLRLFEEPELLGGYVVNSGNSYHFYSTKIMTLSEWRKLMGKLYREDGVDKRWCKLRLAENHGILRLTETFKKVEKPKVIGKFVYPV